MKIGGDLRPGRRTIAVKLADQTVHGNVLCHDVHLVCVDENIELEKLATWKTWIVGLDDAAPAEFLGGAHDMPAGHTAYASAQLTAGRYALIAEVDDPTGRTCCAFSASRTLRATRVGVPVAVAIERDRSAMGPAGLCCGDWEGSHAERVHDRRVRRGASGAPDSSR